MATPVEATSGACSSSSAEDEGPSGLDELVQLFGPNYRLDGAVRKFLSLYADRFVSDLVGASCMISSYRSKKLGPQVGVEATSAPMTVTPEDMNVALETLRKTRVASFCPKGVVTSPPLAAHEQNLKAKRKLLDAAARQQGRETAKQQKRRGGAVVSESAAGGGGGRRRQTGKGQKRG